jgi:release factor glutamine methyltransferase
MVVAARPSPAAIVRRASDYLARHGVEDPTVAAELLLAHVLDVDRTSLYLRAAPLDAEQARALGRALCRRCSGEPLQHITGIQGFRHLLLTVRPGVFIPRPETEVVVGAALDFLDGLDGSRPVVVVDVGTGSGAIALALADEAAGVRVLATDRCEAAVDLARENAGRLGLGVEVLTGDLLDPLPTSLRGHLALVVANPPYLSRHEHAATPAEVRADPPGALIGGADDYRRLTDVAAAWLMPGGGLVMEIGDEQGSEVAAIAATAGFSHVEVLPDLNGRDRAVVGLRS